MFRIGVGMLVLLMVSQVLVGCYNWFWFEIDGVNVSVVFNQEDVEWLWIGLFEQCEEIFVCGLGVGSVEQCWLLLLLVGYV